MVLGVPVGLARRICSPFISVEKAKSNPNYIAHSQCKPHIYTFHERLTFWLSQAAPNSRLSDIDIPKRQAFGRSVPSHKTQERGDLVNVGSRLTLLIRCGEDGNATVGMDWGRKMLNVSWRYLGGPKTGMTVKRNVIRDEPLTDAK